MPGFTFEKAGVFFMDHKTLSVLFTENGFVFKQLIRQGDVALFKKTKGNIESFEVVVIPRHDGYAIPGTDRRSEPAEYYPPSSTWGNKSGVTGFTYSAIESARDKFAELCGKVGLLL
jgi:hypothetical protein